MLRKALLILSGNAAASLMLLARNLIVARMIPVADYGVASTFAMVMAVVEMTSSFGLQQQIVQAKEGEDPRFQAVLQGFQLLRGLVSGLILFAISGVVARFLGIPEVIWAYQLLALVPILNALQHFDIHRLNRQMRFGPLMLTGAVPAAVALALTWPLAWWFGNWQVMLWSILAQALLGAVMSHLMAERPYRLAWDSAVIARAFRFGWPLLVNAALLFLVFQGDRIIVGRALGMETLAIFSMGVTLTLTPTLVLAKTAQNLFLPRLSRLAHDASQAAAFARLSQAMIQAAILNGALMMLVITLLGGPFVTAVLGEKYAALVPLMSLFAILNGLRVCKAGPNVVTLAAGRTGNAMISNLPRVFALLFVWGIIAAGGTMPQVLWLGILAEALGYFAALWLARRNPGLKLRPLAPVGGAGILFVMACALPSVQDGISVPTALFACLAFVLLAGSMTALRQDILARAPRHKE